MRIGPMSVSKCKHKWSFHNRGVVWDALVAKWAGEVKGWVKEMTECPPKKEEVIVTLSRMTRRPTKTLDEEGHRRTQQKHKGSGPGGSLGSTRGRRDPGENPRGDSTTVVDRISGKARHRSAWHIFREHNKEADVWAGQWATGEGKDWEDGSCRAFGCGPACG